MDLNRVGRGAASWPALAGCGYAESMSELVLYHNPRCSKSRAALALLRERGVAFDLVEYLETPPSRQDLDDLQRKLGLPASDWIRKKEEAFREAGLSVESSDAEILDAIAERPILLERPILVHGERAVVGRPTERLLELLDEK